MKAQQRARADAAFREAEKLITKPSGFGGLFWKPDDARASLKYEEAGNNFRVAGAKDLANLAMQRAAQCYAKVSQHYQAAQNMQKAAALMETDQALWIAAADQWQLAGEARLAAETLYRGAVKTTKSDLYWRSLEASADTDGAEDPARQSFLFFVSSNDLETANKAVPLFLSSLTGLDDDHPSRLRASTAVVLLQLARNNIQEADRLFLDALSNASYGPSEQARIAEDMIAAIKQKDQEALSQAMTPNLLAALDYQIAHLVQSSLSIHTHIDDDDDDNDDATTTHLPSPRAPAADEYTTATNDDDDDQDDLPDLT